MVNTDDTSVSLSSLLCDEDPIFLYTDDHNDNIIGIHSLNPRLIWEDEEEHLRSLFRQEMEFVSCDDCSTTGRAPLKNSRMDAVDLIFKTRERLRFQFYTAYLSMTYFDRFLSKRPINEDNRINTRLLSVACLSVAAKLEEHKPPPLSQYITEEDEPSINSRSMKRMELAILHNLEWKMRTVTPFAYLHCLANLFCQSRPEPIVSEAEKHVMAIVKDVHLMDQRPSIIALAATLMASFDAELTTEIMDLLSVISSWGDVDREREKEKWKEKLNTPASSLTAQWSYSSAENSLVTSSRARRKLAFDNKENSLDQM